MKKCVNLLLILSFMSAIAAQAQFNVDPFKGGHSTHGLTDIHRVRGLWRVVAPIFMHVGRVYFNQQPVRYHSTEHGFRRGAETLEVRAQGDHLELRPLNSGLWSMSSARPWIQGHPLQPFYTFGARVSRLLGFRTEIDLHNFHEYQRDRSNHQIYFPSHDFFMQRIAGLNPQAFESVEGYSSLENYVEGMARGVLPLARPETARGDHQYQLYIHDLNYHSSFLFTPTDWRVFIERRSQLMLSLVGNLRAEIDDENRDLIMELIDKLLESLVSSMDIGQGNSQSYFAYTNFLTSSNISNGLAEGQLSSQVYAYVFGLSYSHQNRLENRSYAMNLRQTVECLVFHYLEEWDHRLALRDHRLLRGVLQNTLAESRFDLEDVLVLPADWKTIRKTLLTQRSVLEEWLEKTD